MNIDYELAPQYKLNKRKAHIMTAYIEEAGISVNTQEFKLVERGEVRHRAGKVTRLCQECFDFKELDQFVQRSGCAFGTLNLCKACRNTRNRRKKRAVPALISDAGFENHPDFAKIRLADSTLKLFGGAEDDRLHGGTGE